MPRRNQEPLFHMPDPQLGPGPVRRGVDKQVRRLLAEEKLAKAHDAGLIAAARSLAKAVDTASGHGGRMQSGMQLAALYAQLLTVLEALAKRAPTDDPFEEFIRGLNDEEDTARGDAAAPHGQE